MGVRSVKEYKESLKDDRVVYSCGERVKDVTTDPMLKVGVNTGSVDFFMSEEISPYRDLATVTLEDGEVISRYYYTPKNSEDLLKRHELMVTASRLGFGVIPFLHDIGADGMNAIKIATKPLGGDYAKNAENYLKHLQKDDTALAVAMSDVKGDRHLHPSDPGQKHPDYYVHVVDKNDKGIIVRGAKIYITGAAYANELLVIPCRNMSEKDADYCLAFAVPANAKGLTHIVHPMGKGIKTDSELDFPVNLPARMHTESMIIFDDVFVPWDKVFLCGESYGVMPLVYNFAYMHRHTAASYRIPLSEMLLGMAYALAVYNGVEYYPHIREKLVDLIMYVQSLKSLTKASCIDYVVHEGVPIPNPIVSNIAKYDFASKYHDVVRSIQDIAGGLPITAPTYKDYQNAETKDYMEKYLGGIADVSTEDRLRMNQLVRRVTASEMGGYLEILSLHAEGSMQAQKLLTYVEGLPDMQEYMKLAQLAAGIKTSLPDLPDYKPFNDLLKVIKEMPEEAIPEDLRELYADYKLMIENIKT